MKDKLVSMAPFFVIMLLVIGFGAMQGWFTPSKVPAESTEALETPPKVATPVPDKPPEIEFTTQPVRMDPVPTPVTPSPVSTAPTTPAESGAQMWSTYHGDEQLAGIVDVDLPDAPMRRWRFQANGSIYHGPVSSEKLIHFVTGKGEVFGVDFNGVKAWSRQLTRISPFDQKEGPARVDGPVSCFKETVLVGTMAGVVYALDAKTGETKWSTDIDNTILGAVSFQPATATQADRLFIIGQDDGALHSLALADGKHLWASESIDRCDGSPSSGSGVLAFGSCASALHVISAEDGTILKNITLGDDAQVAGGVAIRGDSVFSGSHSGQVFRADMAKGEVVWINEDAESEVFTTPAVSEELVVFGSMDDSFYALDRATGELRWEFETNGLTMSPAIANDKVVAASGGVLYLLALDTGTVLWNFEVSDDITSPSIIDGMILVGSDDGTLSAFGAADAS